MQALKHRLRERIRRIVGFNDLNSDVRELRATAVARDDAAREFLATLRDGLSAEVAEMRHSIEGSLSAAIADMNALEAQGRASLEAEFRAAFDRLAALDRIEQMLKPPAGRTIYDVARNHVRPGDVVFDIGANRGHFTEALLGITPHVYAFEPLPHLAAELRSKFPEATVIEMAASNTVGESTFFADERPDMFGMASSLMDLTGFEGKRSEITVRTTTIDQIVRETKVRPAFIKIDVEGWEPSVLAGARETIEDSQPTLLFEFWESLWPQFVATFEHLRQHYLLSRVSDAADPMKSYPVRRDFEVADILAVRRH